MAKRPLVAVLAPEPIRPRMAGMGIRSLELARAIGREMDAKLLVPNDPSEAAEVAGEVSVVHAPPHSDLARAAAGASAAVVSGHAANYWFHQVPDVPVAADLYDPFFVENLHYAASLGPDTARHDHATLALARARRLLPLRLPARNASSIGALFAYGRIGGVHFPRTRLEDLLGIVRSVRRAARCRGRSVGRRAANIPERARSSSSGHLRLERPGRPPRLLAEVRGRSPPRDFSLASPNPNDAQRATARRAARGGDRPEGRSIVFSPGFPTSPGGPLRARTSSCRFLGRNGEDLAYRTRLPDAAWGGLPSLSVRRSARPRARSAGAGGPWSAPRGLSRAFSSNAVDPGRLADAGRAGRRFAEASPGTASRPPPRLVRRAGSTRIAFRPSGARGIWRRLPGACVRRERGRGMVYSRGAR